MAWLYAPSSRAALGDLAKLAAALRGGTIPGGFLDGGAGDQALGRVGRVTLLGAADLGVLPADRRFVLARGTDRWCLGEVVAGAAGIEHAARLIEAVARARAQPGGEERPIVGWLIAERVDEAALGALTAAGALATSTAD
jgi:hypothetical protein